MPVFELLERPYCRILRCEPWDAPAGRRFVAYRVRQGYRWLLGNGVVDEFATVSSPLFIAPAVLLGRVYNAGIGLAHRRDTEMALDLGWPPLCAGVDRPIADVPADLEKSLLDLLMEPATASPARPELSVESRGQALERWRFDGQVAVIGTDAPLLPQQLGRLCDTDNAPLTIALATGNRIARQPGNRQQNVRVASEEVLDALIAALRA